jgi:hypothetical protein
MINQTTILAYSGTKSVSKTKLILEEGRKSGNQTAFLSHSHLDANLAKAVQGFLQAEGWKIYIDWEDTSMPPRPNSETASNIRQKIKRFDWFLYLATANSAASRWCPWEIGYADGVKGIDKVVILPTSDKQGKNYGNEYLDLYRQIGKVKGGGYGLFRPDKSGILLEKVTQAM